MPEEDVLKRDLNNLKNELDKRARQYRKLERYYDGNCPFPDAIRRAKVTKAYRMLLPMSDASWASVVVDSSLDRLEVTGISTGDRIVDRAAWELWQRNGMDAQAELAHQAALMSGRCYATVWPENGEDPEITLDTPEQMIVRYTDSTLRRREVAMRCWKEDDRLMATLYYPDGLYKFQRTNAGRGSDDWERREEPNEPWPVPNPFKIVPVVELGVNRRLQPGPWGYARGDFEHALGLIDRVNLLTFLGLVVALWMGFPLRGVIGEAISYRVLKDDNGNPIIGDDGEPKKEAEQPFDAHAGGVFQLENPNAKIVEYSAADRANLSIAAELDQFAAVTKTPRHYFPVGSGIANIAEPTIRAFEGALIAKLYRHKKQLGAGWEEVLRLAGLMSTDGIKIPSSATLMWSDHESRSLAERADAASKVAALNFPAAFVAERFLNLTQSEIDRLEAQIQGDMLSQIARELGAGSQNGQAQPEPEQEPQAA